MQAPTPPVMLSNPQGPEPSLRAFFMGSKGRKKPLALLHQDKGCSNIHPALALRRNRSSALHGKHLRNREHSDPRASAGARISKSAATWFGPALQNSPRRPHTVKATPRRFEHTADNPTPCPALAPQRNRSSALLKSAAHHFGTKAPPWSLRNFRQKDFESSPSMFLRAFFAAIAISGTVLLAARFSK